LKKTKIKPVTTIAQTTCGFIFIEYTLFLHFFLSCKWRQ